MVAKLVVQTILWFGFMGLLLFLSAGTLNWPGAWVFLIGMMALSFIGGGWLAKHDPGLLQERMSPPIQKGQPLADKVLLSFILLVMLGSFVLNGFDAVRFGWSHAPVWLQVVGGLLLLVSLWMIWRTMRENSFAAPVVKIQEERGQKVIDTGPYALVRHPMYTGAVLYVLGTTLLLGSLWGLVAVVLLALLLAIRIGIEEKTLRAGLPGYADYAARVRYRLIPSLW